MPSAETRGSAPALPAGGERARGEAILSAYGLHFADEALSAVRHDVLNRMTALGALSFELRRALTPARAEVGERLEDLNRQIAMVCQSMTRRLQSARPETPPRCAVREVAEQVVGLCQGPVTLVAPPTRLWAAIDPVQLGVALLCLVENALEACGDRPRARVRLRWQAEEGEQIALEVVDGGAGLPPAVLARAFERFFTTKVDHAGLGLCVARTIARRWGGDLELHPGPGESGTRAALRLPAAARRGKAARG